MTKCWNADFKFQFRSYVYFQIINLTKGMKSNALQ